MNEINHAGTKVSLTDGQAEALKEILASIQRGAKQHVLTGYAGTGKTTLMQVLAAELMDMKLCPVMTAPTHKAVIVLTQKLRQSGADVPTMTIHSLLGLVPRSDGRGGTVLKRGAPGSCGQFRAVIIDECSMVGADLMDFIVNDLANHFVLFVGDPAQIPPVNERESKAFSVENRSNLKTIVRQALGNPILEAATAIRMSQGGPADWSWCHPAENGDQGFFLAGDDATAWMQDAFTSSDFAADNDFCRYLCWTNDRVASVNARVRKWIYGETQTPFVPDERVLCRNPVMIPGTLDVVFSTNQEAVVSSIQLDSKLLSFDYHKGKDGKSAVEAWAISIPMWRVELERSPSAVPCWIPQDERQLAAVFARLVSEAKANPARWFEHYNMKNEIADLRSVYAMTVHASQGSTFRNVFLDLNDIRKRERSNLQEMQQLLYVAATRPSHALVVIG
jgi:exodeoxyribonuclease-5